MNSKSFLKFPFVFDTNRLQLDLSKVNQNDWVKHQNSNAYEGIWSACSLKSTDGTIKNIFALENANYENTPLMKKTVYIKELLSNFKTKIEAVRFMRLGANSKIKTHCDKGSGFEQGYARVHIPITSNNKVQFILNGKPYKMDLGKCYYINAHEPHSVINEGNTDRVHLLIDCEVNEWLKQIFLKNGFKQPVNKYGNKSITDENVQEIINSLKLLNTNTSLEMANELEKKRLQND